MLAVITARSTNNCIGKNGTMPWHIPEELKYFQRLTTGNTVIMGRKTYEAIGHPLKDRFNIIVSSTINIHTNECITVSSLDEALHAAKKNKDIFIIGGAQLYEEAIPLVDVMYITEINQFIEDGDTFFPSFDESQFDKTINKTCTDSLCTYTVYTRKDRQSWK